MCIPNRKEYKAWKSDRDESEDVQNLHLKFLALQYLNSFSCSCSSILTFGYGSKLNLQQLDEQTTSWATNMPYANHVSHDSHQLASCQLPHTSPAACATISACAELL